MAIKALTICLIFCLGGTVLKAQQLSKDDDNFMYLLLYNRFKQHQFAWQQVDATHSSLKIRILNRMVVHRSDLGMMSVEMPTNYRQCLSVPENLSDDVLNIPPPPKAIEIISKSLDLFAKAFAEKASPGLEKLNKGLSLVQIFITIHQQFKEWQIEESALRVEHYLATEDGLHQIGREIRGVDSTRREADKSFVEIQQNLKLVGEVQQNLKPMGDDDKTLHAKVEQAIKRQQQLRLELYGRPECFQ